MGSLGGVSARERQPPAPEELAQTIRMALIFRSDLPAHDGMIALDSLLALVARLTDSNATVTKAWYAARAERDAAVRDAATLREALAEIEANALDWHGPEGLGSGHDKALAVIAAWCSTALAAAAPADEPAGDA